MKGMEDMQESHRKLLQIAFPLAPSGPAVSSLGLESKSVPPLFAVLPSDSIVLAVLEWVYLESCTAVTAANCLPTLLAAAESKAEDLADECADLLPMFVTDRATWLDHLLKLGEKTPHPVDTDIAIGEAYE